MTTVTEKSANDHNAADDDDGASDDDVDVDDDHLLWGGDGDVDDDSDYNDRDPDHLFWGGEAQKGRRAHGCVHSQADLVAIIVILAIMILILTNIDLFS